MPARLDSPETCATRFREILDRLALPSWIALADPTFGVRVGGRREERECHHLVATTRLLWTFAHAIRHGLTNDDRLVDAAGVAYDALRNALYDGDAGGFFWRTDANGPVDSGKHLYGQSFAILALVERFRATGERHALALAVETFERVMERAHAPELGGWIEHFDRDWSPLPRRGRVPVEVAGFRSGNAHMHWMEAVAELFSVTGRDDVRAAAIESLEINDRFFYPARGWSMTQLRTPRWRRVWEIGSVSYGHLIEFAWMRLRGQKLLGLDLDWGSFDRTLSFVKRVAALESSPGIAARGTAWGSVADSSLIWWVEAEFLIALATSASRRNDLEERATLVGLCDWINSRFIDPDDGIWTPEAGRSGGPAGRGKHGPWKAAYHEVRAMSVVARSFGSDPTPAILQD